eukprot:m.685645 g.685645  ORF g.685645 m.685645 type:complete len:269 (-) comp58625_c0_seq11:774-1580(-)
MGAASTPEQCEHEQTQVPKGPALRQQVCACGAESGTGARAAVVGKDLRSGWGRPAVRLGPASGICGPACATQAATGRPLPSARAPASPPRARATRARMELLLQQLLESLGSPDAFAIPLDKLVVELLALPAPIDELTDGELHECLQALASLRPPAHFGLRNCAPTLLAGAPVLPKELEEEKVLPADNEAKWARLIVPPSSTILAPRNASEEHPESSPLPPSGSVSTPVTASSQSEVRSMLSLLLLLFGNSSDVPGPSLGPVWNPFWVV